MNFRKKAFQIAIEWHFRDSIPQEWYDLSSHEDFMKVFDLIPSLIDDADLIVDFQYEDYMAESVANSAWQLYRTIYLAFGEGDEK